MEKNVYYYNGQILCKQSSQILNKKKVFPLLYNVQQKQLIVFNVIISESSINKDINKKLAYIGYKRQQKPQTQEKYIVQVNSDKSWLYEEYKTIKNVIDFQEGKIILKGFLLHEIEQEYDEQMIESYINKMKKQAIVFVQKKVFEYDRYLRILKG